MAFNAGVLESELFGHEKGSFTGAVAQKRGRFELAHPGHAVFWMKSANCPPDIQVKLLRVLQERKFERVGGSKEIEVDIRVVAATNKNLMEAVEKGRVPRRPLLPPQRGAYQSPAPAGAARGTSPLLAQHFAEKIHGGQRH